MMHLCMLYLEALYLEVILMTVTTFLDSFTSTKVQEVRVVWLGDRTSTDVRINNIMTRLFFPKTEVKRSNLIVSLVNYYSLLTCVCCQIGRAHPTQVEQGIL